MLLIKNKFYMSSHSHKRVEPNSQKSSKFSSKYSSQPQNVLGTVIKDDKNYQEQVSHHLHYQLTHQTINYPTQANFDDLKRTKEVLLDLIGEFKGGRRKVVIDGEKKDNYEKRLQLLQQELNGLMKQRIIFEAPDREGGTRKLDYGILLNEKQNQIVELEKKIQNLEERLRKQSQRQSELENQILDLHNKIKSKNSLIEKKERLISEEIAYSKKVGDILSNIKSKVSSSRELSQTIIQEIGVSSLQKSQIKSMSSKMLSQSRSKGYVSNEILKLVRGLESMSERNVEREELESFIEGWILGLGRDSELKRKIVEGQERIRNEEKIKFVNDKFKYASQIYKRQIQNLRLQNPALDIKYDENILQTLRDSSSRVTINSTGVIQIEKSVSKTVQVPVQDTRTKQLIHQLVTEMKKLTTKYPKLYDEIDPRLAEFFSQELIDVMNVDEIDRLVEVIKYEPQVVRVQNVYAYSSEKSRKVEFHLRILLKALLTEMEKIVMKTGEVPQIDEGIIGMIKEQIIEVVDVDDILKVYRTVPKIVEVEKVVEKIVEKIVEVPKLIPVENRVEVPVQVKKIDVVENVRNVPLEIPKVETVYVEKLVEVPQIVQKIVQVPKIVENVIEVIKEVPKIVQVEKIVQKIVEVEVIKEVKEEVVVKVPEYEEIIVEREKIVPTEKTVEILKPVEVIVQKVQQVVRQVPKIVEVQKIRQVIVEKPVYYPAPSIEHEVVIKQVPVDRIIQKIVPIIKVEDRIVEVPKIIEKIVEVRDIIKEPIQIEVIREKPIVQESVKVVETTVEKPVIERIEVEKIVQRFIEVPIVQEIIKIQTQYIKEPVIERVEQIIHKQVQIEKPVVMFQDRIVQVQKIINHFIHEPQIINVIEERIVPLEKVIKEPVAVPTVVEKVIEKLVEVPKVVEVQKVVQKVIPVPRVVEKVVEVEKIVQKIVNRIVVEEKVIEIEKLVQVPAIQEKVVEIEVPRNIYLQSQVPVQITRQVLVKDEINCEIPKIHEIQQPPRIVVERQEVPRQVLVEKIVPLSIAETNVVFLDKQIVVPIEIQIPVELEKERFIPIQHIREQIIEVDREREKIVPVTVQPDPNIIEIERIEERPIIQEKVKVVVEEKPYYETVIQEVKTFEEKIIPPVTVEVQKVLRVTEVCDRIVDRIVEMPKVYEVEKKVDKIVEIPKLIEIEKIVPHIINVNSYIETIAEKIVQIPILLERLKEIQRLEEKVVPMATVKTEIKEVERNIQRAVIEEKIQQAVDRIHVTEEILKVADKLVVKEADPVIITQDKVMEVPFVVEKIVQKIVVMPQIVEVLKYVHEITEKDSLGASVPEELGKKEVEYKNLANNLRGQLGQLLSQLRSLRSSQPSMRSEVERIEKFLTQFEKFVMYPKIHEIINEREVEKVVEKRKVVTVPSEGESNIRMQLSKAILIEKLILQMKRLKEENPHLQFQLDEDIKLIFGSELNSRSDLVSPDINKLIEEYASSVQSKFKSMGGWTKDHQFMLNSFLEQRFLMANVLRNANSDLKKTKAISEKRLEAMRKYKYERDEMEKAFNLLNSFFPSVLESSKKSRYLDAETSRKADQWMTSFTSILVGSTIKGGQPTKYFDQMENARCGSLLREREEEIVRLKEEIRRLMGHESRSETKTVYKEVIRDADHSGCNLRIRQLQNKIRQLEQSQRPSRIRSQNTSTYEKIYSLERQIERLTIIERQHMNCFHIIEQLKREIALLQKKLKGLKDSRTIGSHEHESERPKSKQSSSSYGVNYMQYANLQQTGNQGVGEMDDKGFQSTFSRIHKGDERRYSQVGEKRQVPGSHVYKTTYERRQYEGEGEYKTYGSSQKSSRIRESAYESEEGKGSKIYEAKREDTERRYSDDKKRRFGRQK